MKDSFLLLMWVSATIFMVGLLFSHKCFSYLDSGSGVPRNNSMDGLRYVLASMVVFHHMDFHRYFVENGLWKTGSELIFYMGRFGVDMFFMITAYLFWGKIRNKENIDWVNLYKGRIYRIVPLAFFSSFISICLLFIYFGLPKLEHKVIINIASWFDAGFFDIKPPVNDFSRPKVVLSGVTWTLRWEWAFYLFLPVLFFFRRRGLELAIGSLFIIVYLLPYVKEASPYLVSCFAFGILAKELEEKVSIQKITADLIIAFVLIFIFIIRPAPLSINFTACLSIIMLMVCCGGDFFGLLTLPGFIRLGHSSYSIYLLQGSFFFVAVRSINYSSIKETNYIYFIAMTFTFLLLCLISSLTYKKIEMRFIKPSRKITQNTQVILNK